MNKKTTTEGYNIKGFIEFLEAEKLKIDTAITSLKALSAVNLDMAGISSMPLPKNEKGKPPVIRSDTYFGKSFIEACVEYLQAVGEKQDTDQVVSAVRSGGVKISDSSAQTLLTKRGREKKDLVRVGRGEWGLIEWYNK
jgi:hypothetical protein